jgi:response regulator RpfG family c-di-GMP phosphodiesterase
MPGLSGYDLCQKIRCEPATRTLPVLLLTNLRDPLDIVRGLECGADNFITKPYEPDVLVMRIEGLIKNRATDASQRADEGTEITLMGSRIKINSNTQQIFNLLFTTLETVMRASRREEEQLRLREEKQRAEIEAIRAREGLYMAVEKFLLHDLQSRVRQLASDALLARYQLGRNSGVDAQTSEMLNKLLNSIGELKNKVGWLCNKVAAAKK